MSTSQIEKRKWLAELAGRGPTLEFEVQLGFPSRFIAGVDEVGRGCLAGPVVTAAVVLPSSVLDPSQRPEWVAQITDSKLIKSELRTELASKIREWAAFFSVAHASVEEVDSLNIHHATLLAMGRAAEALARVPDHLLIDGKFAPPAWKTRSSVVVKGDLRSLSIACASILAKVERDQWMERLSIEYPGYEFEVHKGYGTPKHLKALGQLGPSLLHRRSFAPVAALLAPRVESSAPDLGNF